MSKFWRVFIHEYLRHVLRKRFIFAVLSLPLVGVAMIIFTIITVAVQYDGRPVGYVDLSGWLNNPSKPQNSGDKIFRDLQVVPFISEDQAMSALQSKKIQAYYVLASDYLQSGDVRLVAIEPPSQGAQAAFENFIMTNLVAGQPEVIARRLLTADQVDVQTVDGSRRLSNGRWVEIALPLVAGFLFMFVVSMTGGYLLRAVVEEKENRTMEIVITSVSPTQLMAGKIAGNISIGLTQLLIWLFFPLIGLVFARLYIPFIRDLQFSTSSFWLTLIIILPAYIMVSALMAAVGATATESSEASQVAGWFTLPLIIPYWFLSTLIQNPNGMLAVGFSFFPLSAPVVLPLRAVFTTVPIWEMVLSTMLVYICAGGSIWLAGRAFRMGMLRYGKPLSLRELFGLEKKTL